MKTKLKTLFENNEYIACALCLILLMIAILNVPLEINLPTSFFIFLRWLITLTSICLVMKIYKINRENKFILVFALIAILFNPIKLIKLHGETWCIVDIIIMIIFTLFLNSEIKFFNAKNLLQNCIKSFKNSKLFKISVIGTFFVIILFFIISIYCLTMSKLNDVCKNYYNSKNYKKCILTCTLARNINKISPDKYSNELAYSYFYLKEYKKSLKYFDEIENSSSILEKGIAYIYIKDFYSANKIFQNLLIGNLYNSGGYFIEYNKQKQMDIQYNPNHIKNIDIFYVEQNDMENINKLNSAISFLKHNKDGKYAQENIKLLESCVQKMKNDIQILKLLKNNYNNKLL